MNSLCSAQRSGCDTHFSAFHIRRGCLERERGEECEQESSVLNEMLVGVPEGITRKMHHDPVLYARSERKSQH